MKLSIKLNSEVYDIETLSNCFTYVGLNIRTEKTSEFIIHESLNQFEELVKHLKSLDGQIGFNNLSFDYPILHFILTNKFKNPNTIAQEIYGKAQQLINIQNDFDKYKYQIPHWKMIIPQLDLFTINHFDNKAKLTSLKALQFWMNYPDVLDMPINHSSFITPDQFKEILVYNKNDVKSTYEFYKLCKDKIELRKELTKKYNLYLINSNDTKIGSDIILDLISKEIGKDKREVKLLRSPRNKITIKNIISDKIEFKTKEFNNVLDSFKSKVITSTKGSIDCSVIFKNFKFDYGTGGIHGCIKPGIYESDDKYVIIDADVSSLYPFLAILLELYPEHLGKSFIKVYKSILEQRIIAKKNGDKAVNEGLKLALNGSYGKSSDKNSFLYDPKFTMAITVNGQLFLSMLSEVLGEISSLQFLQINTDGITVKLLRSDLEKYYSICKQWEKYTGLNLEFVEYKKMIINDVNNYIAVKFDDSVKYKGLFEINKEFHKDTSFKIVQIALSNYFVKGKAIEETIKNHNNIYDFCGRQKFKSDSYGEIRYIGIENVNGSNLYKEIREKQQKTTRYYISNKGATFVKVYPKKNKESFINKDFQVTIFNKYVEKNINQYDINYDFYIIECKKIIESIEDKQLTLF